MSATPDAKLSVVFTTERVIDEDDLTILTAPNTDGRGQIVVARFTANQRHEGGEYDAEGQPRSFWLRFTSPPYDQPYVVTHWVSRREMRAHLEDLWPGWWVTSDGCDLFAPDFDGDSLHLPNREDDDE